MLRWNNIICSHRALQNKVCAINLKSQPRGGFYSWFRVRIAKTPLKAREGRMEEAQRQLERTYRSPTFIMATKKLFISSSSWSSPSLYVYVRECTSNRERHFLLNAFLFKHARNLADEAQANAETAEKRKLRGDIFLAGKLGRREEHLFLENSKSLGGGCCSARTEERRRDARSEDLTHAF